jgi:hypothetical protein
MMNTIDTQKETGDNGMAASAQTNPSLSSLLTLEAKHSRNIATSAGNFRLAVAREVESLLNERPGNQLKTARAGTKRLVENKLITAQEAKELDEICQAVFSAQRGKTAPDVAAGKVRGIHDRLLANAASSPVAVAIASIASSGPIQTPADNPQLPNNGVEAVSQGNKMGLGMIGGAIGGALIGLGLGGIPGATFGAVIGGAVGAIVGVCS